MLAIVILIGIGSIVLERIIPGHKLPMVKGWWLRIIFINSVQLGIILVSNYTWNKWFLEFEFLNLSSKISPFAGGLISYLIITFIFYWWHRLRHDINLLWLVFHQVHHSAQRLEAVTTFYKHPLEILVDTLIISFLNFSILGIGVEGAAWTLLFTGVGEIFYHMNIRTPYLLGFFFQRPEMHRIHHEMGRHYKNFSDLPLWDILFGTFENPKMSNISCGFKSEREQEFLAMMLFKNVNEKYDPSKKYIFKN